ncbi:hypothetical protein FRB90_012354 [Tulasnella sp. 427]|nr:hypothetical protein FRB90_012354 [Tulasnella sp. 427]
MDANEGTSSHANEFTSAQNHRSRILFLSDLSPLLFGTPPVAGADHQQSNLRRLFAIFGPTEAVIPAACRPDDSSPEPENIPQVPPGLADPQATSSSNYQGQNPMPPPAAPRRNRPPERIIFAATVFYVYPESAELAQASLNGTELGGVYMSASLVQGQVPLPDILNFPDLSHTGQPNPPTIPHAPVAQTNGHAENNVDMLQRGSWNGETRRMLTPPTHFEGSSNNLLLPPTTFQPLSSPGTESGGSASSSYVSLQHPTPLHHPQPIRPSTVDPAVQRLERQIEILRLSVQHRAAIPALQHSNDFGGGHRRRPTPLLAEPFRNMRVMIRRNTTGSQPSVEPVATTTAESEHTPDDQGEGTEVEDDVWARRGQPPEFR